MDGCESDPEGARRVNAEGAENAARAAALARCPVLHVSTDFVFDGRKHEPYTETDPPAPLSEYGRSKHEGERRVAAAAPEHLIVRTSWLYGPGRGNFVDAIRARARSGAPLRVVSDQFGSPTYVVDLARAIGRLIQLKARGLVHFANLGVCSRHALALAIVEIGGVRGVPVEPISTGEAARPAVRPARSPLDSGRYARLSGETPRPWREALQDYLLLGGRRPEGAWRRIDRSHGAPCISPWARSLFSCAG